MSAQPATSTQRYHQPFLNPVLAVENMTVDLGAAQQRPTVKEAIQPPYRTKGGLPFCFDCGRWPCRCNPENYREDEW